MEAARAGTTADLGAVAALAAAARDALADQRGGPLLARHEAHRGALEVWLGEVLASPVWTLVVGTVDEVPLGYGVVELRALADGGRLAVLHDLYVDAGARGIGVGEAMMKQVTAWSRGRGALGIDSMVLPGDRATKNFFETQGLTARAIVVHRSLVGEDRRAAARAARRASEGRPPSGGTG